MFSCPRYSWCIRYESKNAPFKTLCEEIVTTPTFLLPCHRIIKGWSSLIEELTAREIISPLVCGWSKSFQEAKPLWKTLFILNCYVPPPNWIFSPNCVIVSVAAMKVSEWLCGPETVFLIGWTEKSLSVLWKNFQIVQTHDGCIILIMEDFLTLNYSVDTSSFLQNLLSDEAIVRKWIVAIPNSVTVIQCELYRACYSELFS